MYLYFEGSAWFQTTIFQATLDIKEADKEYSYMYHTRCHLLDLFID